MKAIQQVLDIAEKSGQCSVSILIHGWWQMPCGGGCSNGSRTTGSGEEDIAARLENLAVKVRHVDHRITESQNV
ncbi:hypothetical protein QYF61_018207 [Mycteria americana]|uniref:Uncharacterized protein n=1 Tax=Mycteria americana TaxID=33587 RepID=A0AAN7S1D2_MYCAM|nr:hypothetical protein QYF61_018207 [Mycteria americana]